MSSQIIHFSDHFRGNFPKTILTSFDRICLASVYIFVCNTARIHYTIGYRIQNAHSMCSTTPTEKYLTTSPSSSSSSSENHQCNIHTYIAHCTQLYCCTLHMYICIACICCPAILCNIFSIFFLSFFFCFFSSVRFFSYFCGVQFFGKKFSVSAMSLPKLKFVQVGREQQVSSFYVIVIFRFSTWQNISASENSVVGLCCDSGTTSIKNYSVLHLVLLLFCFDFFTYSAQNA